MTLDAILIVTLIIGAPLVAWLAADTLQLRRDLDRTDAEIENQHSKRLALAQRVTDLNARVWTLENQLHDSRSRTADLDVPDIDEHLDVPDYDAPTTPTHRQEPIPCPTTYDTHSPASDTPSDEHPETSSTDSPTNSTPTPNSPALASTSPSTTPPPDTHQTSMSCENSTDAPGAPGTWPSRTTSTGTGDHDDQ